MLGHMDIRRLTVLGLLTLTCALLFVGLTNIQWCMPALHSALVFATALGTWWLAREDLALNKGGAGTRLVLTGVALGLGLTWVSAGTVAVIDVAQGAQWTSGEFAQVVRRFIEDVARHWTPLGLVASFVGTALSLMLNEIGSSTSGRGQQTQ
ncbi:MAG TPA: hypothetical protein VIF08_00300 [Candidatus Limnocylindrales bacterium]